MRRDRASRPWHLYALAVVAVAVVVLAIVEIGPPTSSARTSKEVVTAEDGVVQSTVTGTGNVQAGTDVDVNFKTSGTLQHVDVSVGQHVTKGQLLATLDPTTAQLSLDQAEDQLVAAQDQLTEVENGTASGTSGGSGNSSNGGGSGNSSTAGTTTTALTRGSGSPEYVSYRPGGGHRPGSGETTTPTTTTTTPTRTQEPASGRPRSGSGSGSGGSGSRGTSSSGRSGSGGSSGGAASGRGGSSTNATQTTTTPSPSSIASAEASVFSAEANVRSAQAALNDTKLFAPASGTIASLASLVPDDSVSAGSTSNASGGSSSSSSSSSTGGGNSSGGTATAGGLGGGSGGSSSSSGGSGSSSSPFAEIVNTGTMTMTVAFSESDISKVKVGKPATITFDALPGVELGAHVTQISPVGSTSSGVVSYNATLTLDQGDSQVKPGMSASAAVIVSQAQGVTVPNQAVTSAGSLGTVNVLRNGKTVSQQVVVGLKGDSRTQIISGLHAGQQVVITIMLPSLGSGTGSTSGSSGTLGGGGLGGGAGPIFRGGGGGLGGGGFFQRAIGGGG